MKDHKSPRHQAAAFMKHAKHGKEGAQNAGRAAHQSIRAKLAREIEEQTGKPATDWQVERVYKARMTLSIAHARAMRKKKQ